MHGDVMNTQQLMDPDRGKNVAKSDDDTKTTITRKKNSSMVDHFILQLLHCEVFLPETARETRGNLLK
jgi:hypothetical protein